MGSFDSIVSLISDMGAGLSGIFKNANALYAAYFIAFFGIIYWLVFIGLSKGGPFKDEKKGRKVVSIMFSVIAVGSIFYRYRSIGTLLEAMGGFIGTLFILIAGIVFAWGGVELYKSKRDDSKALAIFFLSLCMYIASSILLPLFGTVSNFGGQTIALGENVWLYEVVITRFKSLRIIGDMLAYIQAISGVVFIGSVLWLPFSLIKGSVDGMSGSYYKAAKKNPDIKKARKAIERLNKRIRNIDTIFKRMKKIFGGS